MGKTCNGCNINENDMRIVPYFIHESEVVRLERIIKRQVVALSVAIALILCCNALWLYAWAQYDYISEETTIEAVDGVANYIGNDGDIINGENNSQEKNTKKEKREQ